MHYAHISDQRLMSKNKAHSAHISVSLPKLHRAMMDIVREINRPERDAAMLEMAGLSLERALFPLIVLIERLGPIGVVDLSARVGRDYTTVSRQVGRLEELGLVIRSSSERDRRVREASITPQGKTATDAVDTARDRIAREIFRKWSRSDFDELSRLMRMLADEMNSAPMSFK